MVQSYRNQKVCHCGHTQGSTHKYPCDSYIFETRGMKYCCIFVNSEWFTFKECQLRGSGVKCGPAVVTRWIF